MNLKKLNAITILSVILLNTSLLANDLESNELYLPHGGGNGGCSLVATVTLDTGVILSGDEICYLQISQDEMQDEKSALKEIKKYIPEAIAVVLF